VGAIDIFELVVQRLLRTIEIPSGLDGSIVADIDIQKTVLANRDGVREGDNGLARVTEIVDRLSFGQRVFCAGPALPQFVVSG